MYFTKMKNLNVVPCNYFYTILFFFKVLILVVLSHFSPFFRVDMCPGKFKHRYRQTRVFREGIFTRSAAQSVLSGISSKDFQKFYSLKTPKFTSHYGEVQCTHASIFIAGKIMLV